MAAPTSAAAANRDPDRPETVWASKGFIASVVVALLLVIGAVVIFTHPHGRTPPIDSTATTTGTGADAVVPATAPATIWTEYQGVTLPSSPTAGPTRIRNDVASGFAHSSTGALFADAQLSKRYLLSPEWEQVLAKSVVPGPGVAAYRGSRAQFGSTLTAPDGGWTQTAGFKFLAYNPAQAVIEFLNSTSSGDYTVTVTTVRWLGGDWKLVLGTDGSASSTLTSTSSPNGFAVWRASP